MSAEVEWIEEGLYARGPEAPRSPGRPEDWVEIPHENFIPIPRGRLVRALRALPLAQEAGEAFEHLLELSEGLLHFHYLRLLNQLKDDYEFFEPNGGSWARTGVGAEELGEREQRFVENALEAVVRANYVPFRQSDWTRARAHEFLLDVPVEIDWSVHDPSFVARFLDRADAAEGAEFRGSLGVGESLRRYLDLPREVGTHALIFYRGMDREVVEGRFVVEKLERLVDGLIRAVTAPVVVPLARMIDRIRGRSPRREGGEAQGEDGDGARSTIFSRRWLRRRNLRDGPLLRGLWRVTRLQEPTLKQVILLFRLRQAPEVPSWLRWLRREPAEVPPPDPAIHIKTFWNVPLADMEILFPEKHVRMKSRDAALLVVTGLAAIPALIRGLGWGSGAGVLIAGILVVYMVRVVAQYVRTRRDYLAQMTRDLYEKTLDNNAGVIQFLIDALEEQEFKEVLLAYVALWQAEEPLSAEEVDAWVEAFLQREFKGVEVDFEVDDALSKIVRGPGSPAHALPLAERVEEAGEIRYRAKPLPEALRELDARWDGLYDYSG